jgi:hypothetical protein
MTELTKRERYILRFALDYILDDFVGTGHDGPSRTIDRREETKPPFVEPYQSNIKITEEDVRKLKSKLNDS